MSYRAMLVTDDDEVHWELLIQDAKRDLVDCIPLKATIGKPPSRPTVEEALDSHGWSLTSNCVGGFWDITKKG